MGLSLFIAPSPVLTVPIYEVSRLMPLSELTTLVYKYADMYEVNRKDMLDTVLCEAEKTLVDGEVRYVADGQSHHIRKDGTREQSYGLAQWYIPAQNKGWDGEIITEATSKDPLYSLRSMALYFSRGDQHLWSCWKTSPKNP